MSTAATLSCTISFAQAVAGGDVLVLGAADDLDRVPADAAELGVGVVGGGHRRIAGRRLGDRELPSLLIRPILTGVPVAFLPGR